MNDLPIATVIIFAIALVVMMTLAIGHQIGRDAVKQHCDDYGRVVIRETHYECYPVDSKAAAPDERDGQ